MDGNTIQIVTSLGTLVGVPSLTVWVVRNYMQGWEKRLGELEKRMNEQPDKCAERFDKCLRLFNQREDI